MTDWLEALLELGRGHRPSVLVTVAEARGSTPRVAGTKMIVTNEGIWGTIGGGQLEFEAIGIARDILGRDQDHATRLERFPLGPNLGQCCGGMVSLLFERIASPAPAWIEQLRDGCRDRDKAILVTSADAARPGRLIVTDRSHQDGQTGIFDDAAIERKAMLAARRLLANGAGTELLTIKTSGQGSIRLLFETVQESDFHILLFGAGHVGKALVRVLQGLPCRIMWADPRAHEFPDIVPANVTVEAGDQLHLAVDTAPPGSFVLIMTHSHALDLAICARALERGDLGFCGLIGSATKLARFRSRLAALGLPAAALDGLTCPIGIDGISGKHPAEIAIAVAAQLLQRRENGPAAGLVSSNQPIEEPTMAAAESNFP